MARIHVSDAGEPDELLVKLGLTQAELHLVAGRTRDAVDAYRDALRRLAGVHPATSRRSAVLANNLAVALLELDQTDEAESVVRASYEAFVDQGVDHAQPDWAAMLRMLGIIHATQGRQREARGEFEQALRLLEGRDDERSRRQVLELYQHLAVLEYQRGDHERARASFERLLSEQIAYFGHDDVELLWTLDSLAELALEHGQVEQARAHAVRRLRIAEQGYGVGHPEVAMAEMMLGKVLLALGIEAEAGLRLERAHRRLRDSEALPLWRAESAYHYARYLHRTGAVDRARTVLARARAILESASDGFLLLDTLDDWAQEHEVEI